jgi:hypothetical protein
VSTRVVMIQSCKSTSLIAGFLYGDLWLGTVDLNRAIAPDLNSQKLRAAFCSGR